MKPTITLGGRPIAIDPLALIACSACRLMRRTRGVPCIRHALERDRPARAKAIGVVRT